MLEQLGQPAKLHGLGYQHLRGNLGQGSTLLVSNLLIGEHTITLQATDSDGQTSQVMVVINVILSASAPAGGTLYFPLIRRGDQ